MDEPIRVILADDHAVVRAGIRKFLEQAADIAVIAEAADGETAQALVDQLEPDVVVLDIQMPKATGIQVARAVRAKYPDIGILILTSYDDDPYVVAVLRGGANGYVLKTASPAEIMQAVRDVYEGKSVLDPAVTRKLVSFISEQDRDSQPPFEPLTNREIEVLQLTGKGFTNKAIGLQLTISDRTVQGHLAKIYGKLDASSRTEAVMKGLSLGLITAEILS